MNPKLPNLKLPNIKLPAKFQFSKKKEKIVKIGLDWGFSSLKVVILESPYDTYILQDARIIQLPSKDIHLRSLLKDLDLSGGVNLGICGPNVVVRYVAMAKMNEEEFRRSIRYEAASHLPFPVEESSLDGTILKGLPDNQMLAMLAAAKNNFIKQRLKLFQEAGIKVNVLDIDSLALINAFNYNQPRLAKQIISKNEHNQVIEEAPKQEDGITSGAVALLNIGASVTNINILENGIPHFTRDINVAGKELAQEASQEVAIANFVAEIRKSFDYYEAASTAIIKKIFLSGGGSLISDLGSSIENYLGIKIEQWDPFSNFEFAAGSNKEDIQKNSAQFVVAVGLALR
ncbi:MAG: pilus assembly protein PilM [Candidatus Omnitrophota bacterium]|jgi:type IV pilus assembly protein PilM